MQTRIHMGAIVAFALAVSACDSNDDPIGGVSLPPEPERGQLRIVHAVADAPSVDVGNSIQTFVSGASFKDATGFFEFVEGTLQFQVDANVPGGQVTVIPTVDFEIAADTNHTVIAAGQAATGTIAPLVITNPNAPVSAGNVRVEAVHAAPNAPAVDIFVTGPEADLVAESPIAGGATPFGANSGQLEVPAGEYRIRVTLPGELGPVFDSGAVMLPEGADLLVIAVENTGPGESPISLLVADGEGSFEILDSATPAAVRVVHAVPDAPAVDVYVNDPAAANAPALSDLAFGQVQPGPDTYAELPAGVTNVLVTASGNAGVIAIPATDLELAAGQQYTVYATGTFATIAPFVTADDDRPIATEARVRLLHMSPGAGVVDIYVTAPMTDIQTVDPTFAGVEFLADTGYVSLAGGSYEVTITSTGTKTIAIGPLPLTLSDGGVYTAAARDPDPNVPNDGFGVIVMDDF